MPEILPNRFRRPATAGFLIPESRNFNGLILIRFCPRARHAHARPASFGARSARVRPTGRPPLRDPADRQIRWIGFSRNRLEDARPG